MAKKSQKAKYTIVTEEVYVGRKKVFRHRIYVKKNDDIGLFANKDAAQRIAKIMTDEE